MFFGSRKYLRQTNVVILENKQTSICNLRRTYEHAPGHREWRFSSYSRSLVRNSQSQNCDWHFEETRNQHIIDLMKTHLRSPASGNRYIRYQGALPADESKHKAPSRCRAMRSSWALSWILCHFTVSLNRKQKESKSHASKIQYG